MITKEEILKGMDFGQFIFRARFDFKFFCERLMTYDIETASSRGWRYEITPFHLEWFKTFMKYKRAVRIAPRGSGKTSILGVATPIYLSMFMRNIKFMVISQTERQAKDILLQIKNNIEHNEVLNALKPKTADASWTKTELNTSTGCRIFSLPYSNAVRGRHVNYILLDEASTYGDIQLYFDAVVPCADNTGHIMLIGTPVSEVDLLMRLTNRREYPDYNCKIYRAYEMKDGRLVSLWETKYSKDQLEFYKRNDGIIAFNRNYLCSVVEEGSSLIPMSACVKAWKLGMNDSLLLRPPPVEVNESAPISNNVQPRRYFGGVDLAMSPKGDYSVYLLVEKIKNMEGRYMFKVAYIYRQKGIDYKTQEEEIIRMCRLFKPVEVLVDKSTFGETFLQNLLLQGMPVKGFYFTPDNRNQILKNLIKMFDEERIIIPRRNGMPESHENPQTVYLTDQLTKECTELVADTTPRGMKTFKTVGAHDDMLMALALAVFAASQEHEFSTYFRVS